MRPSFQKAVPQATLGPKNRGQVSDIDSDKNSCILFHGSASLREALLTLRATRDPHRWASHRCRQERTYGLTQIWMAETKVDAGKAFDLFEKTYAVKYEKAVACLAKDRDVLLAFYDLPAEHWKHLRTTNPIESTFATVRHRTIRAKGCMSNATALAMVFNLIEAAQRNWRRLDGTLFLPKVIYGVKFKDGIEEQASLPVPQAEVVAA
jgi:hypothetical protein